MSKQTAAQKIPTVSNLHGRPRLRRNEPMVRLRAAGIDTVEIHLDQLAVPVVVVDSGYAIEQVSESAARMFGYASTAEMERMGLDALIPSKVRKRHRELFNAYMEAPTARTMAQNVRNLRGVRRDGQTVQLRIGLQPIGDGRVAALVLDVPPDKNPWMRSPRLWIGGGLALLGGILSLFDPAVGAPVFTLALGALAAVMGQQQPASSAAPPR